MIYVSSPGKYDPSIGDYLGELTKELKKGEHIVEFVSGGPKNYAYKTKGGNEMCKVRGFTLHVTNGYQKLLYKCKLYEKGGNKNGCQGWYYINRR